MRLRSAALRLRASSASSRRGNQHESDTSSYPSKVAVYGAPAGGEFHRRSGIAKRRSIFPDRVRRKRQKLRTAMHTAICHAGIHQPAQTTRLRENRRPYKEFIVKRPNNDHLSAICLVFFLLHWKQQGGADMSNRERLIECGYTEEMAADICRLYENDESGLSMFVHIIELFFDDRREYV